MTLVGLGIGALALASSMIMGGVPAAAAAELPGHALDNIAATFVATQQSAALPPTLAARLWQDAAATFTQAFSVTSLSIGVLTVLATVLIARLVPARTGLQDLDS